VPNTIRCITTPCPGNDVTANATFSLKVTNTGGETVAMHFNSGQQFNFELIDAAGAVVKGWSDDRAFIMALTKVTLAPGASKTFTGTMELKDRDGMQLEGTYTVRGVVLAGNVAQPQATKTITVTIQQ
jgi:hypothetical protein